MYDFNEYKNNLRLFGNYCNKKNTTIPKQKFIHDNNDFALFVHHYNLRRLKKESEFDTQIAILRWVHEKLFYGQYLECDVTPKAKNILEYAKENRTTVNCFHHAIVLTQTLLALGFRARTITCLQSDGFPFDNHVVTEVYSSIYNKWYLLDATICSYFKCKGEPPLSLIDLRYCFINGLDTVCVFQSRLMKTLNKNFTSNNIYDYNKYKNVLIYNLYILEYYIENTNIHIEDKCIRLVPEKYMLDNVVKALHVNGKEKTYYYTNDWNTLYERYIGGN